MLMEVLADLVKLNIFSLKKIFGITSPHLPLAALNPPEPPAAPAVLPDLQFRLFCHRCQLLFRMFRTSVLRKQ